MGSIGRLKRGVVDSLLVEEDFFLVIVDPHHPKIVLPESRKKAGEPVGLHIGWRLARPIPDLHVDDQGITATLSFDGLPFCCFLPWSAMMQLSNGAEHLIWICPPSERKSPQGVDDGAGHDAKDDEKDDEKRKNRPKLRLV